MMPMELKERESSKKCLQYQPVDNKWKNFKNFDETVSDTYLTSF